MVCAYRGKMGDKETNDNLEIELNVMKEQKQNMWSWSGKQQREYILQVGTRASWTGMVKLGH